MLQAALGGYYLYSTGETEYESQPTYYEPGFSILFPLELEAPKCDMFYILIRKRADDTGSSFVQLGQNDIEVTVRDVTSGEDIPTQISTNDVYSTWDSSPAGSNPLVIQVINSINLNAPTFRTRVMDVFVKEIGTSNFITFRVTVSDEDLFFHYIPFSTNSLSERYKGSAPARSISMKVDSSGDSYLLISPYASVKETTDKSSADFSYPLELIYYKRYATFNDEDYTFAFGNLSHDFQMNNLSIINVPGYQKAAVLLIDSYLYTELLGITDSAYAEIQAQGELSGIVQTFTVNFIR